LLCVQVFTQPLLSVTPWQRVLVLVTVFQYVFCVIIRVSRGLSSLFGAEFSYIAIRTGSTPSKRPLSPELMPWDDYKNSTDEELTAMFLYLKSLPALPSKGK